MNLADPAGVRLTHGKPKVNGVESRYAIGGGGEPVLLLRGLPLLTPHYTVIAVDNRHRGRQPGLRRLQRRLGAIELVEHDEGPQTCPV